MASSEIPRNPYPGLRPFEAHEDYLFFGREGQADELLRRLGKSRFVAVVGTSGSGKSSLVKAGLLPALHGGFMVGAGSDWRIALFRPGCNPIHEMALALNDPGVLGSDPGDEVNAAIQTAMFEAALRRSSLGLVETVRQARLGPHENLLLVVDQFEELFRFNAPARDRKNSDEPVAFVKLLLKAVKACQTPIYIVITMRSDFLGDCTRFRDLPEAINDSQYLIPRMTRDQRRLAIEGPASVCRVDIAPRLVQHLLNDVGDNPDQLPILQHALMRTWEYWRASGSDAPDLEHYEAAGRLERALSRHADEVYGELPDERSRMVAEKLFKCITAKGADNRGIRRATRLTDLCEMIGAGEAEAVSVIEAFRRPGRSFLAPPVGVSLTANSMVDISHESLMRIWHRLVGWVEEEAESARMYRRLAETAELHREKKAGLLRDPALQLALDWRERNRPTSTWATRYHPEFELAMDFLEKSRAARDIEIARVEQERQRELERVKALADERQQRIAVQDAAARRQKKMILAVTLCLLITIVLALLALKGQSEAMKARKTAEKHQRISRSRELAAFAAMVLETDPTLSFRLAEAAFNERQTTQAEKALFPPLENLLHNSLEGHEDKVTSAAFSPGGKCVVTASDDHTARIWDVKESRVLIVLKGHGDGLTGACFSPDGRLVATASRDDTLRIWDAKSGRMLRELKGNGADVTSVSFSRDGERIVTASRDNAVRIWDPAGGKVLREIKIPHDSDENEEEYCDGLNSASFSPDGKQIVIASEDDTAQVWDAANGEQISVLDAHLECVKNAVFSPDGERIVTASDDDTALVWNAKTGSFLKKLAGHTDDVVSAVFSGDGAYILTASKDNTARIWDAEKGKELHILKGHSKGVNGAAFSPDGKWIITASDDKTARIWRLKTPHLLDGRCGNAPFSSQGEYIVTTSFKDDTVRIWGIKGGRVIHAFRDQSLGRHADRVFSPDGKRIVTTSVSNNTACIWDVEQGKRLNRLQGHSNRVKSAEFSVDGARVVTASTDNTARIWDAMTGKTLFTLEGHGGEVTSATFSADGERVVTASMDNTVRIWNAKTGDELHRLEMPTDVFDLTAALSPDGKRIVTNALMDLPRIWDARDGTEPYKLKEHTGDVSSKMFSPDGMRIVIASKENTARILDAGNGKMLRELRGHTRVILNAVFSPDGKRIVTTSEDGTTRIWNVVSGEELYNFRGQPDKLLTAAFSPDGKRIVITSKDDTTRICITDPRQVLKAVNEEKAWGVVRKLTPAEKERYGFKKGRQ